MRSTTARRSPPNRGRLQGGAAGARILITGNPDRILEYYGAGQPYLSKPFPLDGFCDASVRSLGQPDCHF